MTRIIEFDEVQVKGIAGCTVRGNISPADPEVGIFRPSLECPEVIGPDGQEILLTAEEEEQLCEQLQDRLEAYYYGSLD